MADKRTEGPIGLPGQTESTEHSTIIEQDVNASYIRALEQDNAKLQEHVTYWCELHEQEQVRADTLAVEINTARAVMGQRIHELEADNAHLIAEVAEMRGAIEWEQYKVAQARADTLAQEVEASHLLVANLEDDVAMTNLRNAELERQVSAWQDTAAQCQYNSDFYRGVVAQIGAMFGVEARTSDDGSVQEDVLALKVPELVQTLREQFVELEADEEELRNREDGYRLQIADLSIINQDLSTPCRCDLPQSGSACNRCCLVRAALLGLAWSDDMVRMAFDAAVREVTEEICP
jgi:hypothetical protein